MWYGPLSLSLLSPPSRTASPAPSAAPRISTKRTRYIPVEKDRGREREKERERERERESLYLRPCECIQHFCYLLHFLFCLFLWIDRFHCLLNVFKRRLQLLVIWVRFIGIFDKLLGLFVNKWINEIEGQNIPSTAKDIYKAVVPAWSNNPSAISYSTLRALLVSVVMSVSTRV